MPQHARDVTGSENLVSMGGVALNCVANSRLFDLGYKNVQCPQPCVMQVAVQVSWALHLYDTTGKKVKWNGSYLGLNIEGPYS